MECFGSGYDDDIHSLRYKLREKQTHRDSSIKTLKNIVRCYQISIELVKDDSMLVFPRYSEMNSQVLRDQLVALFEFQKYWFEYLIKIQTSW